MCLYIIPSSIDIVKKYVSIYFKSYSTLVFVQQCRPIRSIKVNCYEGYQIYWFDQETLDFLFFPSELQRILWTSEAVEREKELFEAKRADSAHEFEDFSKIEIIVSYDWKLF